MELILNNWWIASLELAGIWSREQAEHVSNEIRKQIHSDRYVDTYNTLEATIERGKFEHTTAIDRLEAEIAELKAEISNFKKPIKLTNKKPIVTL